MPEHPQIRAFRCAAALMREERYWCRNRDEDVEFVRALTDVLKEVSSHLDAIQALDCAGLLAYGNAAKTMVRPGAANLNAEMVLMTAADNALERLLATGPTGRNTGVSKGTAG